jgi:hypothetical protein
VLRDVYQLDGHDTAQILKNIGYGIEGITAALKSAFALGMDAIGVILAAIGF